MTRLRRLGLAFAVGLGSVAGAQTPAPQLPVPDAGHPYTASPGIRELSNLLQNHELTIDEAIGIALATNRGYATAVASLERAGGRTGQARSALNPTAGINTTVTEYDKPIVAAFGPTSTTLTNQFNPIFNASVSLPIDITGAIKSAVGQAQFNEVAARIDVNRARNQLVFDVRNAFYNALRAQGQLVVAQDNLTNANARLEDARSSLKAETGTQFDVLTAQRDVADAEQAVVSARGGVTIALGLLKNAIGIDVSTPIKITDTGAIEEPTGTPPPVESPTPVPSVEPTNGVPQVPPTPDPSQRFHTAQNEVELGPDYLAAVQEAVATRPEVLESDAALTAAEKGVAYARRSSLPSLAVTASYVLQPNAGGFTPERQGALGLSLNFPIFDGGLARAREREAKADVSNAKTNRRAAIDGVTLDVQQAFVNLVQARERAYVVNVGVAQAREAFRLARLRALVGVSSSPQTSPQIELSNAQTTLTQAETNRVNALYDYNIARAQLDRAIGRFSYGPGSGYAAAPGPEVTGRPKPAGG